MAAYDAYNRQDVEGLLALVTEDVDWPDGAGPDRLHGRGAVRRYWTQQWKTAALTHDEPVGFATHDDGRTAVRIRQVIRQPTGSIVSTGTFVHLHRLDGDRIATLEIQADATSTVSFPADG